MGGDGGQVVSAVVVAASTATIEVVVDTNGEVDEAFERLWLTSG